MLDMAARGEREHDPGVMRDFTERVAAAAGVVNAADAALVALTAEALREGLWEVWRIHTPAQWLRWQTGIGGAKATAVLRLAQRFDELPTTVALHAQGRLSLDQAATIARYTPAEFEASVAELALQLTVAQIVAATAKYDFDVVRQERDAKADAEKAPRGPRREMSFGSRSSDEWSMRAVLPADEGAIVEEALRDQREKLHAAARQAAKEMAAAEGRSTDGTDAELGVAQPGWVDALVGVAKTAAASSTDGASVADRVAVMVHLRRPEPGEGDAWQAEMTQGPALPEALRRYLTCDCDIATVWHDGTSPVQLGRSQRIVPRRIRRIILRRDKGCRVPGCTRHLWLKFHHIVHWEDDGETVTWNLLALCDHHHRLHHQGWLQITGNADATEGPDVVRFTTPTGEVLAPAGQARPPMPVDMPQVAPYRHPDGGRLDGDQIWYDTAPRHRLIDPTWTYGDPPPTPPGRHPKP